AFAAAAPEGSLTLPVIALDSWAMPFRAQVNCSATARISAKPIRAGDSKWLFFICSSRPLDFAGPLAFSHMLNPPCPLCPVHNGCGMVMTGSLPHRTSIFCMQLPLNQQARTMAAGTLRRGSTGGDTRLGDPVRRDAQLL